MAHLMMLKAIAAGKRKNDRVDARKIADLPGCDYFPARHMEVPEVRDRCRVLRFRNLLVHQAVRMKNKVHGDGDRIQQREMAPEEILLSCWWRRSVGFLRPSVDAFQNE